MIRVGIVGATGYGGRELLRLLVPHPHVTLTAAASTTVAGRALAAELPAFRGLIDLDFAPFDAEALAEACDVVFVGVPGGQSMELVAALRGAGVRVIDLGPDFRLHDTDDFKQYYGAEHTAAHLLEEAVYGLAPWYRDALKTARLVAVPGCYPISAILPLRPLLEAPLAGGPAVIDSISGVSGAGKGPSAALHFPEMNENLRAYKVGAHQHTPEIEQELLNQLMVQFTPHIAPLTRGILSTITVRVRTPFDPEDYYKCYADEPFIRCLGADALPDVRQVAGSNFCDFGWVMDERTGNLIVVSAIDNLLGGTAGMAVQCMNLMFGIEETAGLRLGGMAP